MTIRTFRPGDDIAQVSIYNEAAASLPKFKPATVDEIRRRTRAADFAGQAVVVAQGLEFDQGTGWTHGGNSLLFGYGAAAGEPAPTKAVVTRYAPA